jgi:hypothetical protein
MRSVFTSAADRDRTADIRETTPGWAVSAGTGAMQSPQRRAGWGKARAALRRRLAGARLGLTDADGNAVARSAASPHPGSSRTDNPVVCTMHNDPQRGWRMPDGLEHVAGMTSTRPLHGPCQHRLDRTTVSPPGATACCTS